MSQILEGDHSLLLSTSLSGVLTDKHQTNNPSIASEALFNHLQQGGGASVDTQVCADTHPIYTPSRHTLSTDPLDTPSQLNFLLTHPLHVPSHHTHPTHLINTPSRHTLSIHPINPPYQPTLCHAGHGSTIGELF